MFRDERHILTLGNPLTGNFTLRNLSLTLFDRKGVNITNKAEGLTLDNFLINGICVLVLKMVV